MSTAEALEQVRRATGVVRQGTSPDVDRIYNLKMAHNQSFTVTMFGMVGTDGARRDCRLVMSLYSKYGLPLGDVKPIARDLFAGQEDMFRRRYGLTDTAALVGMVSAALQASDDVEEWSALLRATVEYLTYLGHAIATRIPWHELSVAFEGVRTVHEGYYDRLVT
jgi:hypothetical protein